MSALVARASAPNSTLGSWTPLTLPGPQAAKEFFTGEQLFKSATRRIEIVSNDSRFDWLASALQTQINSLLELEEGWDGRRGRPVTDTAISSGVAFVFALAPEVPFAPQVFPLASGGIQAEWHAAGHSVEIEVDAHGELHALATDQDGAFVLNEEFPAGARGEDLAPVRSVLDVVARRVRGAR